MHEPSQQSADETTDEMTDRARKDGLASMAILVVTVALIAFLVSRIV